MQKIMFCLNAFYSSTSSNSKTDFIVNSYHWGNNFKELLCSSGLTTSNSFTVLYLASTSSAFHRLTEVYWMEGTFWGIEQRLVSVTTDFKTLLCLAKQHWLNRLILFGRLLEFFNQMTRCHSFLRIEYS